MRNTLEQTDEEALPLTVPQPASTPPATAPGLLRPENIHRMTQQELLAFQKSRGYGDVWGTITLPEECRTRNRKPSSYVMNLAAPLKKVTQSEEELQLGITTLVRMFLLCV